MPKDETKVSYHDWHYSDVPKSPSLAVGGRVRTIGNWINYKDVAGAWKKSVASLREAKVNETFLGLKVAEVQDTSPMFTYIGDPAALGGIPWTGLRLSDKADTGIISFLPEALAVSKSVDLASQEVSKSEVMLGTDLYEYAGTDRAERWFALMPGAKPIVKLGFILPEGWTIRVESPGKPGSIFVISDENGEAVYKSRPARAVDSTEKEPKDAPCWFEVPVKKTLDKRPYWEIAKVCDPSAKGLVWPVLMDDTTTISGTAAIEDAFIRTEAANYDLNNGGRTDWYFGYNDIYQTIFRVVTSSIPTGTITAATMNYTMRSNTGLTSVTFYSITDANTWVEGTASGSIQAGSCCANYAKYNMQPWAGSVGLLTAVTDFRTTDTASQTPAMGLNSIALPPIWFNNWKSGVWVNNGFKGRNFNGASYMRFRATEDTIGQPTFDFTYTPPPAFTHQRAGLAAIAVASDNRPAEDSTALDTPYGKDFK